MLLPTESIHQWAPKRQLKDFPVVVAAAAAADLGSAVDEERPSGSVSRCVALCCRWSWWSVEETIIGSAAVVRHVDLALYAGWGTGSRCRFPSWQMNSYNVNQAGCWNIWAKVNPTNPTWAGDDPPLGLISQPQLDDRHRNPALVVVIVVVVEAVAAAVALVARGTAWRHSAPSVADSHTRCR